MKRALVLGGTGVVGLAIARRLLAAGWSVDLVGRDPDRLPSDIATAGGRFVAADRHDSRQLASVYGDGADLLVDCVCYTAEHARRLLPFARESAATVMLSSKAVYVDDAGRHTNSVDKPRFSGPVPETAPTLPAGEGDYTTRDGYGANKVAAEQILLNSGYPVTVLRPSKVHGADARRPREWYFVKRALDRRPAVLLAGGGSGADHPTAAANLAALVETVAAQPGCRILNSADPDVPNGRQIARTIAERLDHRWDEILLDDRADTTLGHHPWDSRPPIVLDTGAADQLGYRPAGDYSTTVATAIDWLVSTAHRTADGTWTLPTADPFFADSFDYRTEDEYLRSR
jgi:nucleoside-diphosphate-sugar epimerase